MSDTRWDYFEVASVCKISCTCCCDVRDSGVCLAMLSQCRTLVCLMYDELVRMGRQAVVAHFTSLLDGLSRRDCLGGRSLNPGPSEKCYALRHDNWRESAGDWRLSGSVPVSCYIHSCAVAVGPRTLVSSVSTVTSLGDGWSEVRIPTRTRDFPPQETGCKTHRPSFPSRGYRGYFRE